MIEIKKLPLLKFAVAGVLFITLTSCSSEVKSDNEEKPYSYLTGEYETSYGKLVITSDENYLLTEDGDCLSTYVDYHNDGTADISIPALVSDAVSKTVSVIPYHKVSKDSSGKTYYCGVEVNVKGDEEVGLKYTTNTVTDINSLPSYNLVCNEVRDVIKIFIDKNKNEVKPYKVIRYLPDIILEIDDYPEIVRPEGSKTGQLKFSYIDKYFQTDDSGNVEIKIKEYTWTIDSPFTKEWL
ncbi:hypothetical protein HNP77_001185 [Treponema rectale]|uniref:Lipoprotein n=1 Tax=Treponema rectale TaxID=744512 RepID=A0A840SFX9_9SPIR|nr:hypothetical protein [Treponema rectale]MBB5218816.1 hypothetical protein [Treponema rectale]